ncbi:hypothetical protein L1887_47828 [Cichorium endivia]|nr:hypothetical protein L1887_47828 [Cichorium endivia]
MQSQLRPQATSNFGGMGMGMGMGMGGGMGGGLQPQQTGYMGGLQPQQTGYMGGAGGLQMQPTGLMPQMTGMPIRDPRMQLMSSQFLPASQPFSGAPVAGNMNFSQASMQPSNFPVPDPNPQPAAAGFQRASHPLGTQQGREEELRLHLPRLGLSRHRLHQRRSRSRGLWSERSRDRQAHADLASRRYRQPRKAQRQRVPRRHGPHLPRSQWKRRSRNPASELIPPSAKDPQRLGRAPSTRTPSLPKKDATAYKHDDADVPSYKSSSRPPRPKDRALRGSECHRRPPLRDEASAGKHPEAPRQAGRRRRRRGSAELDRRDGRSPLPPSARVQDDIEYYNRRGGRDSAAPSRKAERRAHASHARAPPPARKAHRGKGRADSATASSVRAANATVATIPITDTLLKTAIAKTSEAPADPAPHSAMASIFVAPLTAMAIAASEAGYSRDRYDDRDSYRRNDDYRARDADRSASSQPSTPAEPPKPRSCASRLPHPLLQLPRAPPQEHVRRRARPLGSAPKPSAVCRSACACSVPSLPPVPLPSTPASRSASRPSKQRLPPRAHRPDAEAAAREEARKARLEENRLKTEKASLATVKQEIKEAERSDAPPPAPSRPGRQGGDQRPGRHDPSSGRGACQGEGRARGPSQAARRAGGRGTKAGGGFQGTPEYVQQWCQACRRLRSRLLLASRAKAGAPPSATSFASARRTGRACPHPQLPSLRPPPSPLPPRRRLPLPLSRVQVEARARTRSTACSREPERA